MSSTPALIEISVPSYTSIALAVGVGALVLLLGFAIGVFLKRVVFYVLNRVGFNEWFKKFAIGRAILRSGYSGSEFFGLITSWVIYVTSVLLAVALFATILELRFIAEVSYFLIYTYVFGFVKVFIIVVIGFIFVDAFIGYIYKSSELKSGGRFLTPTAEYLRILLYLAIIIFALEQGGLSVHTLNIMLVPVVWGLTIAMIAVVIVEVVSQVIKG